MKSKRTKALDISAKVRREIHERDGGCIFCEYYGFTPSSMCLEIMHYVPRSAGGLGIPQNLALGCIKHHRDMDQGLYKNHQMMKALFRDYLKNHYPDWDESSLVWTHDMNYGGGK